jgi:LysM repeat protein
MKRISWLFACLFTLAATAQEKLVIKGTTFNQYVTHVTGEGESVQSISSQFGQSVTKLSRYNDIAPNAVLPKGSQVKIPITQYNLIRVKGDENSAPVYQVVGKGDNLSSISKSNGVSIARLKEWNNLKTDAVKNGQAIIIGYMVNAKLPAPKKEEPVKEPVTATTSVTVRTENVNAADKTAPKKQAAAPTAKTIELAGETEAKATVTKPPVAEPKKRPSPADYVPREGDEGYFALGYTQHAKEQAQQYHSGDAATFKTISGWSDRKYYVLINDVAPETIVRITAPNNKSICAKVLGPLQETKGGSGLLLRMSNSAASTLGITDQKFTVTVTYFE